MLMMAGLHLWESGAFHQRRQDEGNDLHLYKVVWGGVW
jgi:hypothetical protein